MNAAIGLIETRGIVPLVEATDSMVKAANVTITDNAADTDSSSGTDGGGVYVAASATLELRNGIIAGNANTPGYSRQVTTQATNIAVNTGAGAMGQGVHVQTIKRMYDSYVNSQVNTAQTQVSQLDAFYSEISQIDNFVSINSVLEVDLFGQANAEMIDHRQVSGTGGLLDFVRGARMAAGGRSIIALPSTAGRKRIPKIVAKLDDRVVVSCPRSDIDIVVTEHGVARLRDLALDERAEALIALADPEHRPGLAEAWARLRRAGAA